MACLKTDTTNFTQLQIVPNYMSTCFNNSTTLLSEKNAPTLKHLFSVVTFRMKVNGQSHSIATKGFYQIIV